MPSSTSDDSSSSLTYPENSAKNLGDCRGLQIRRNQLSQIFDSKCVSTLI